MPDIFVALVNRVTAISKGESDAPREHKIPIQEHEIVLTLKTGF